MTTQNPVCGTVQTLDCPVVLAGIIERIGDTVNSCLIAKSANPGQIQKWNEKLPVKDHVSAMQHILEFLSKNVSTSIDRDVQAVGHRIVHGLTIHKAVLLSDPVLKEVEKAATLAPLHNPPGLQGVHAAKSVFKGVPQVRDVQQSLPSLDQKCCIVAAAGAVLPLCLSPLQFAPRIHCIRRMHRSAACAPLRMTTCCLTQVGVFDTAFHQTMPPHAYMYGLPYELYEKHNIRRYGFHGTSHRSAGCLAAAMLLGCSTAGADEAPVALGDE